MKAYLGVFMESNDFYWVIFQAAMIYCEQT